MKTVPPAQAEDQLTSVANRFDAWRQTRTTRAAPIPQHLWEQAMAVTAMFPLTRVARRLRVSGGELKKRCAAHHAAQSAPASTALGFVDVTATPVWPHPTEDGLDHMKEYTCGKKFPHSNGFSGKQMRLLC